jgi:3-dehydroquinate dehydratase/shikimate dehydrogenase
MALADRPRLCVTVTAPTLAALRARRDAAVEADLVELRLDTVADPDVRGALAGRTRPVIVTCRPTWEGGMFRGGEDVRRRLLAEALEAGAEYVDIEWRAGAADLVARRDGRGIVLSMHDFEGIPADLEARVRAMLQTPAEVVKVAVHVDRLSDLGRLAAIGRSAGADRRLVIVAMGRAGWPSRVLAAHLHSRWTYAGGEVALGQIAPARLLGEYRFRRVTAATAIYGVLGRPIAHSVSPAMHNAAFAEARLDAVYVPLEAADVEDFVEFARAFRVQGASVTAPFKRVLVDRLDEVDATGRRVGAVNTIKAEGERWRGTNTDVAGFLAPLEGRVSLRGCRAAILGAGGAARAAAVALADAGARVTIHARDADAALAAAAALGVSAGPWPPDAGSWDLLVNATPVGTAPHAGERPLPGVPLDGRVVYDLVYNPPRTRLLEEAAAAGCLAIGGLPMLVEQARRQFLWWTGVAVDRAVFEAAARAALAPAAAAVGSEVGSCE